MRSTLTQKAQRLNAAQELVTHGGAMAENALKLSREFGLSLRQAYRYLEEAQTIGHQIPFPELSAPATFKLPRSLIRDLHAYSAASGLTLSEIVRRALVNFLAAISRHG
ncbi:MAG: ribbon-helix-helix protein, CopG family [Sphingomicrobium sp.]